MSKYDVVGEIEFAEVFVIDASVASELICQNIAIIPTLRYTCGAQIPAHLTKISKCDLYITREWKGLR